MSSASVPTTADYPSVFDLCNTREKRFLVDMMQREGHVVRDHPLPELHALLLALERMWGGPFKKVPTVPLKLLYYLVIYATYAHQIPEDIERWRTGAAHDVYHMLQGFMESLAFAIKDGSLVKHEDDGVYLDLFHVPQWYYDAVMKDQQTVGALYYMYSSDPHGLSWEIRFFLRSLFRIRQNNRQRLYKSKKHVV